jgi:hypothetical protein
MKSVTNLLTSVLVELDTCLLLRPETEVSGRLTIRPEPDGPQGLTLQLILCKKGNPEALWIQPFALTREDGTQIFRIPRKEFADGGYYQLLAKEGTRDPELVCHLGVPSQKPSPTTPPTIEEFLRLSLEEIFRQTSIKVPLNGREIPLPTCNSTINRGYLSLGHRDEDGKHSLYNFSENPWSWHPTLLDVPLSTQLKDLGATLRDNRLTERYDAFVEILARHGFDPRSGLGYFGEESVLELPTLTPRSKGSSSYPKFKPFNTGTIPCLPNEDLWKTAPDAMQLMMKSMFTGLVTDPKNMEYNRFCFYNFDARSTTPALLKSSAHCGFESSGARMILWWVDAYCETEEPCFLDWARRMFAKWAAVQDSQTGLIPNFFGAVNHVPGADAPPGKWSESRGTAMAANLLTQASLRIQAKESAFGGSLKTMALRLAHGILEHAYRPNERSFHELIGRDGRPLDGDARYAFPTREAREDAAKTDSRLAKVSIYDGGGFYRRPGYWSHCAGTEIPVHLASIAANFSDHTLALKLAPLAADFDADRAVCGGPFTKDGVWRFSATAYHIRFLLELFRILPDPEYVQRANEIAEEEIQDLSKICTPDWWRMPDRSEFIAALLQILRTTPEAPRKPI